MIVDIIKDTLIDCFKMLPFLFAAYFVIEYIEHKHSEAIEKVLSRGGRLGFIPGAFLGLIPQCGFSAMAANLYSSKVITVGTLLAVFLSTSDEAVPLMVAMPGAWNTLLLLLLYKLITAIICGLLIDLVIKRLIPNRLHGGYEGHIDEIDCHEHVEEDSILVASIRHTLHIFVFIIIIVFILNSAISYIGSDNLAVLLGGSGVLQIATAGLIGMIPNCAASILLTQMYGAGQLSLPALLAGLSTGAGVGPLILLRTIKNKKQGLLILLALYLIGTGCAIIASVFM